MKQAYHARVKKDHHKISVIKHCMSTASACNKSFNAQCITLKEKWSQSLVEEIALNTKTPFDGQSKFTSRVCMQGVCSEAGDTEFAEVIII